MNSPLRPPLAVARAGERAVHRRAARLAERLLRRLSLDGDASPRCRRSEAAALMPGVPIGGADEDDGAPWHDQTMPIAERMKLAEGRPLRRRMMAAMAPAGLRPVRLQLQGLFRRAVRARRKSG